MNFILTFIKPKGFFARQFQTMLSSPSPAYSTLLLRRALSVKGLNLEIAETAHGLMTLLTSCYNQKGRNLTRKDARS